jgi:hypothetical protein
MIISVRKILTAEKSKETKENTWSDEFCLRCYSYYTLLGGETGLRLQCTYNVFISKLILLKIILFTEKSLGAGNHNVNSKVGLHIR